MNTKKNDDQFGKVILLGRTNVGKSTLLNKIIKEKISITSKKKNTTRNNIFGIHTEKQYQTIYIDTPGYIKNSSTFICNSNIKNILNIVKVIIFVVDRCYWTSCENKIKNIIEEKKLPIVIVITKIDLLKNKEILLPHIDFLKKNIKNVKAIIPFSTKKKINLNQITKTIQKFLPFKKHKFKKTKTYFSSLNFYLSEIIREKLIRYLGDEIPFIIDVIIESFTKINNEKKIKALILVNNYRQKMIILGKNGNKIKLITYLSKKEIEKRLKTNNIILLLWIKVRKK